MTGTTMLAMPTMRLRPPKITNANTTATTSPVIHGLMPMACSNPAEMALDCTPGASTPYSVSAVAAAITASHFFFRPFSM